MLLGACAMTTPPEPSSGEPGAITEVPEEIRAIAAPQQDLTTVKIAPEDGCYYYLWQGPVEATYLPVRTNEGRPICTKVVE